MRRDLGELVTLACLLEASAPKPGNVSPGRPFHDMRFEDFLVSALAIGPALGDDAGGAVGERILSAVRASRRRTAANTNLGIILLLAPLAEAARRLEGSAARRLGDSSPSSTLRARLSSVLDESTVSDAVQTYAAIREARAGGLGQAKDQDLSTEPTVTLREAMRLAASHDSVAAEWSADFPLTFEVGLPALRAARAAGLDWAGSIVEAYLALLEARPDTLIARKLGPETAAAISDRAGAIRRTGGPRTAAGRAALEEFDADLRDPQNSRNPGTTADLTAAAIFAALLEDGWAPDFPRNDRAQ